VHQALNSASTASSQACRFAAAGLEK
jgi:hypothetical protein